MASSDPMHNLSYDLAKNYASITGYSDPTTNSGMIRGMAAPDQIALNLGDVYNKGKQVVTDFIKKNNLDKPIGQDQADKIRSGALPAAQQRGNNYIRNRYNMNP